MGRSKAQIWVVGGLALVASAALLVASLDGPALGSTFRNALGSPVALAGVLALYATAFLLRALIWSRVLPGLSIRHGLAALHVSLLGNHVLPLRLGEALRVTSVVRRAGIRPASAIASTVMLRAADVLAVVALAAVMGPRLLADLVGIGAAVVVAGALGLWVGGLWWLKRLRERKAIEMRTSSLIVAVAAVAAWVLESGVMWQAAHWAGIELGVQEAVLVTAVTIAAQTVALAPGGLGTYEAAATAALVALGADPGPALAAALAAHATKTLYAFLTGCFALFVPAPSEFGRLRLPKQLVTRGEARPPERDASVVLFLPAHNEVESVGDVVRRVPQEVLGRRVECIVVDDGSTDGTAEAARLAGATVVRLPQNQGLGAGVRRGLSEGSRRGAAAVAFCDADGEYSPEELEVLVRPILEGEADYVCGSRFAGRIERMLPHRRFGNKMLTVVLRFIARCDISDGQTGYRAFSASAARDAEIIHDFNYAQVLTLDLLAKGYRYHEVPISYSFREAGKSFVKLGRYLRHVIPAIHRELNSRSVLDDVRLEHSPVGSPPVPIEASIG